MIRRFAPLAALALAACQQSAPDPAPEAAPDAATPAVAAPQASAPAAAPDTSDTPPHLALTALATGDGEVITANMAHVGGCQFTDSDDRLLVMIGLPDDNNTAATGVARAGGRQAVLTSEQRGYTAIEAGPVLRFEGLKLTVAATGAARKVGVETRARPATLTASDADGKSAAYTGTWSCGV